MAGQRYRQVPQPGPIEGTSGLDEAAVDQLIRLTRKSLWRHELGRAAIITSVLAADAGAMLTWSFAGRLAAIVVAAVLCAVAVPGIAWTLVPWFQRRELKRWSSEPGSWVVGFFDATATQLVHPADGGWLLSDHMAVQPGTGGAANFRRHVFIHLANQADTLQVPIMMSTRSAKLAGLYRADMPGLELLELPQNVQAALFGREYRLRREPMYSEN